MIQKALVCALIFSILGTLFQVVGWPVKKPGKTGGFSEQQFISSNFNRVPVTANSTNFLKSSNRPTTHVFNRLVEAWSRPDSFVINPLISAAPVLGTSRTEAPREVLVSDCVKVAVQPAPILAEPFTARDASRYDIVGLDVEQGMNSSYVTSIFQDGSGRMWFGTDGGGVSLYDGYFFFHYTTSEGLINDHVKDIFSDRQGNLWFCTWGGISKYDGIRFVNYGTANGLSNGNIKGMVEDRSGKFWFASNSGIHRLEGKRFLNYTEKQGLISDNVSCIAEDGKGRLWIGTDKGLDWFNGYQFFHYGVPGDLLSGSITCLISDKRGGVWVGTDQGFFRFDGTKFIKYQLGVTIDHSRIKSMTLDCHSNLWIATYGEGVYRFDGHLLNHYKDSDGLNDNYILSGFEDHAGNLWFGSFSGINKFNPNSFRHFTERDGLRDKHIISAYQDRSGNLWFGSLKGISKFDGTHFSYYTTSDGLSDNFVWSIAEDNLGNMWFGTNSGGVCKFNGASFKRYTLNDGFVGSSVYSILKDSKGQLWFGTNKGVCRFDGLKFFNYNIEDGISDNNVWVIREDKQKSIWFGTWKGVTKYDGNVFTKITTDDGLPDNSVRTILEDKKGRLWFGTENGGLCCYDDAKFTCYDETDGLSSNSIWSACEDRLGNLWLGTDKGLNCLIDRVERENSKEKDVFVFHKREGLKAEDFLQNAMILDRDNRMWMGTGKALTMLDMECFRMNQTVPEVSLDNLLLQEKLIDFGKLASERLNGVVSGLNWLNQVRFSKIEPFKRYPLDLELPYSVNHLTFNFSAIDWLQPGKLNYKYRLLGQDATWSELSPENKADYKNISPGTYTFSVKCLGGSGFWSEPASYSFTIHPPWWQTSWAYFAAVVLVVLCIAVIAKLYGRNMELRANELKNRVDQATHEITRQKNLIEEKHREITDSINYAERIQKSFLASSEVLDHYFKDYFLVYLPKDVVSGDFYWVKEFSDQSLAIAVADSTGHGVPGAIMSILNINSLERASELSAEPNQILNYSREFIIDRLKRDGSSEGGRDGMDISLMVFDKEHNNLSYAAANNSIWVIRDSQFIELSADKMPVGKHEYDHVQFQRYYFPLKKGDQIYCFTDGIKDQFGGDSGKKYKCSRLKQFLLGVSDLPMNEQQYRIMQEFRDWKRELEQVDDVTIVGIRIS